jgi:hypothetical protein
VDDPNATNECHLRVITMYSMPWHYRGASSRNLPKELEFGPLLEHYELYREQLPRLLPDDFLGGEDVAKSPSLERPVDDITPIGSDVMLFALPSNQVVLAVIFTFTTHPLDNPLGVQAIAEVLEQSIFEKIKIGEQDLPAHVETLPVGQEPDHEWERVTVGTNALHPERHQLVFITRRSDAEQVPRADVIDKIVYRKTPPYSREFARPQTPAQLNLSDNGIQTKLGVVTPYVSLLYGHQRPVENSIFLSTVHAVGTASTFRQIWHESYKQVREFRDKGQAKQAGTQTRAALEKVADNLGNLEFDLTFSVEFPLMRIETFHSALYEAMDLSSQAGALSQMFTQLGGSFRSEITAIDVRERQREMGRKRWNAFAAGVLSLIGVSVGFVIAFLGINTTQVPSGNEQLSMWDSAFATVYLVGGLFALIPGFLILIPYLRDWVNDRDSRNIRETRRPLWTGLSGLGMGAALLGIAVLIDESAGRALVADAILKSFGVLALLIGATLGGLYLSKQHGATLRKHAKRLLPKAFRARKPGQ